MRLAGLFLLISLMVGCTAHKEEDSPSININVHEFSERKVTLRNNLGELSMLVPIWLPNSWWSNGESMWIINDSCQRLESYVFSKEKPPGLQTCIREMPSYGCSISFFKYSYCEQKNLTINNEYMDSLKQDKAHWESIEHKSWKYRPGELTDNMELKTINDRTFLVQLYIDRKMHESFLIAETILHGQKVTIRFSAFANDCDTFIQKMDTCLMSIKIKD